MKKHANVRSVLIALSILLAMGMGTAVFAEPETELDVSPEPEQIVTNTGLDHEELMEGFMLKKGGEQLGDPRNDKTTRRSKLSPRTQPSYDAIRDMAERIAYGNEQSASVKVPMTEIFSDMEPIENRYIFEAEDLNVDWIAYEDDDGDYVVNEKAQENLELETIEARKMINAVMADAPYDLYWYDKTEGILPGFPMKLDWYGEESDPKYYLYYDAAGALELSLSVSPDYLLGDPDDYLVDKTKTLATVRSADEAARIVTDGTELSDYRKLDLYKDEICERVEYNYEAAEKTETPYGDPWQMIWVFDGNYNTNVVCEGYSKAYKYLCDLTTFSNSATDCYLVEGTLYNLNGENLGPHMWNLVTFGDGENYLVDITNCDEEIGCTSDYFLKGDETEGADYYIIKNHTDTGREYGLQYKYDNNTVAIYGETERKIAKQNYDPCRDGHGSGIHVPGYEATCVSPGRREGIICENCGASIEGAEWIEADGHEYLAWTDHDKNVHIAQCDRKGCNKQVTEAHKYGAWKITTQPTYDKTGVQERECECEGCGHVETATVPKKPKTSLAKATVTGLANKTYNGKACTPAPTVKLGAKTLKKGTDYTVAYSNNKNVGTATVTITGKTAYSGTLKRTFKINPKGTAIKTLTAVDNGFTVKWNKQATQTTGYRIQYCLNKNFKSGAKIVTVKGVSSLNRKIVKLKNKKVYYVRVQTYRTVNKANYYSAWSGIKSIKTK